MAEIVLVNPRFDVSYWGLEYALPLVGKRANLPTACLPLLAALTPGEHRVTVVDENVEAIDYARLARADMVGLTGMSVQRRRMREILEELKRRGVFTVVGGPWITVQEDAFEELADVIFVGEAEETWPRFLREWQQGVHASRYEQAEKTDMTKVPLPRYDLLKLHHYLFGSVQFSRGCPYQCEFCDIIVTFGRRPRLKTSAQILAELEMHRAGPLSTVFIVDDNLIGNKKAVKALLREVADWQRRHGYPLAFFTEASLELADDPELLAAMVEANITAVFIGIESPNEESLRETKKLQNVRPGATIVERVRRIQDAGLDVWCGMIVGFDHDDASVFHAQREFLREARILHAMAGMLSAIPKTPLHARLAAEGRLDDDNENEFGSNVIPLQMTRETLRDGYVQLMQDLYEPKNYFARLDDLVLAGRFRFGAARTRYWKRHPWAGLKAQSMFLLRSVYVFERLMTQIPDPRLRRIYRQQIMRLVRRRPNPVVLFMYLLKCVTHFHHHTMAQSMAQEGSPVVNSY
jgi:radical SAM superfamily enzyme YgiQ (UPF0313 family)